LVKEDLLPAGPDEKPVSSQIPFYIMLMEKNKRSVGKATYYGFSDAKSVTVFSREREEGKSKEAWFSEEEIKPLLDGIEEDAREMVRGIRGGRYGASPSDRGCKYCPLKRLCRTTFFIR